jgi:holo-[acyl-carrier protein] synthase
MIVGLGSDVVSIPRIQAVMDTHGEKFLRRCFAPAEIAYVEKQKEALHAAGFAKRWAAKEACAKALGLGIRDGIYLRDIAVINDAQGKPQLTLTDGALKRMTELAPKDMKIHLQLSLSDEPPMAFAVVIAEAR